MATAVQLSQGNEFSRSSEDGRIADSATRVFKVLLGSPDESWNIPATIGVDIGDVYSDNDPIPCVSIEARADGQSRLIRIVTARYKSTAGFSSSGTGDPKSEHPTTRPALYSMSTSLAEIAAWGGRKVTGGASGPWAGIFNPVGDMVDGVTRLEPIITINVDQYSSTDQSSMLQYCGCVNSDTFQFSDLSIGLHQCMLQSVSSKATVEQFGGSQFRGFLVSFQFAVRRHFTYTRNGPESIGWDLAVPQTGFNIINSGLGNADVLTEALVLEHQDGKVWQPQSPTYATSTQGKKMRAMVGIPGTDGSFIQRPAAQPVALNDNGTPRNTLTQDPKVLINRICLQPEFAFGTNFSNFGIRWIS